jgi:hypothetical protein
MTTFVAVKVVNDYGIQVVVLMKREVLEVIHG